MEFEWLTADDGPAALATQLRELVPGPEAVSEAVARIVARVREGGDAAAIELTERYDTGGSPAPPMRVEAHELEAAQAGLDPDVRQALKVAFDNVYELARAGSAEGVTRVANQARECILREEPVHKAAVYVPGGRAPYPSTVVMGVAAARAAGVPEVIVCSPPPVDPVILGACRLCGADEAYRIGGAHAVAALAFGTDTIPAVDVIVGPGNVYVQEAKRQVSTSVGIDGFAGPSDLMVIVDEDDVDLHPIALDLLAQAEHGAGTIVVGVSTSPAVLEHLRAELAAAAESEAVVRLVHARSLDEALALAEAFAPEHLQLVGAQAEALAPRVTRAGCVFVGPQTGTAFGDYIVGSNHILPTNGSARFASGLSAATFRRRFTQVRILDASSLALTAAPLARAEGFELHAQSMEARIRDNRPG